MPKVSASPPVERVAATRYTEGAPPKRERRERSSKQVFEVHPQFRSAVYDVGDVSIDAATICDRCSPAREHDEAYSER